jgi:hypothetical protein
MTSRSSNRSSRNGESLLQARQEGLDHRTAELVTDVDNSSTLNPSSTPPSYVASIKSHVPITLDRKESNYTKWREHFLAALGHYGLTRHVLGTVFATPSDTSPTSNWVRDDYTVLSWMISSELFGTIMAPGSTARQIRDAIASLFQDNKQFAYCVHLIVCRRYSRCDRVSIKPSNAVVHYSYCPTSRCSTTR